MRLPLPGACFGLSLISSSNEAGREGILCFLSLGREDAVSDTVCSCSTDLFVVSTGTSSIEAEVWEASIALTAVGSLSCGSAYTSGLGACSDERVLLVEDDGASSVSSFLLLAEVFASLTLCVAG